MPILDEILSQPAILISVVVAVLFIVAAMVLAVLPRMKASRARAKRRKAQNALRQENLQLSAEEDGEEVAPSAGRSSRQAASSSAAAPVAAPAPTAKPQIPVTPSAPVVTASALNAALSGGTTETKKDEVTPEMQSLLSSVFSDEENSERQAILLKGIEPVSIDELLILSKAVSSQLRGEQPTNIVRVKENELV